MNDLLKAFIKDIRIESVKFRMQTSVPHKEIQRNDIIGNFDFKMLDGPTIGTILGEELSRLQNLEKSYNYVTLLADIVKQWNTARVTIQYEGYGYGNESNIRRSKAYSYVLLTRVLKKQHKELYKLIK